MRSPNQTARLAAAAGSTIRVPAESQVST